MRTLAWKDYEQKPATELKRDEIHAKVAAIFIDAMATGELLVTPPFAVLLLQSAGADGKVAPGAPATLAILVDGRDLSYQVFGFLPWHTANGRLDFERMARDAADAAKLAGKSLHQSS